MTAITGSGGRPPGGLWSDRAFVLFFLARAISMSGSALTLVVLPVLVYQMTRSALQTALLGTIEATPYLVFGLVAGAVADRVNRRRLMVACDGISAVSLGAIPFLAGLHLVSVPIIYGVGLLSATVFVWFDAANFGALPALVGKARLVPANSALWTASALAGIAGPAAGGVLIATMGAANALAVDAVSFALSAVLLLSIGRRFGAAQPARTRGGVLTRTLTDIRDGLRFIWRQPLIRTLTLLGIGNSLTAGAVMGLLVVYGVEALGFHRQDPRVGWLFTAVAVGGLAGIWLVSWLHRRLPLPGIALGGYLLNPLLLVAIALVPRALLGPALLLLLLWELTHTAIIVAGISVRQFLSPDEFQGRVNATARLVAWGGSPFGAALGGAIAGVTSVRAAYLLMALGVGLSAVAGFLFALRNPQVMKIAS